MDYTDYLLKKLIHAVAAGGLRGGNVFADGIELPPMKETWEYEDVCPHCDTPQISLYNDAHISLVSIYPSLEDLEESGVKEEVVDQAVDNFSFGEMAEDFNPYDMTLEELIEYDEDFEEEVLDVYEEHAHWRDKLRQDFIDTRRSYVWPVNPNTMSTEHPRSTQEMATLLYRYTGGLVYMVEFGAMHRPPGMEADYGFIGADSGSSDITMCLCIAYICAGAIPPARLISRDFLSHLKFETVQDGGILEWIVIHALAKTAGTLRWKANLIDEVTREVEEWLDASDGEKPQWAQGKEARPEDFTKRMNAYHMKGARAALLLQNITAGYGKED